MTEENEARDTSCITTGADEVSVVTVLLRLAEVGCTAPTASPF